MTRAEWAQGQAEIKGLRSELALRDYPSRFLIIEWHARLSSRSRFFSSADGRGGRSCRCDA
jgi:hypothetical protein